MRIHAAAVLLLLLGCSLVACKVQVAVRQTVDGNGKDAFITASASPRGKLLRPILASLTAKPHWMRKASSPRVSTTSVFSPKVSTTSMKTVPLPHRQLRRAAPSTNTVLNVTLKSLIQQCVDEGSPYTSSSACMAVTNADTSAFTDMSRMFAYSDFNGDISKWNVSAVNDTSIMFIESEFNGDISKWNTAAVRNMGSMFEESPFNGDISGWNVGSVTDMSVMFYLSPFNGDISKWDVSAVERMNSLFLYARAFNANIGSWDVSKVAYMSAIFTGATAFNQELCCWNPTVEPHGWDKVAPLAACECLVSNPLGCIQGQTVGDGGGNSSTCTCWGGFADIHGNGTVCKDIDECKIEEKTMLCDYQAECYNTHGSFACVCPEGLVGDGMVCSGSAWAVRSVFAIPDVSSNRRALGAGDLQQLKLQYARLVSDDGGLFAKASAVTGMPFAFGALDYAVSLWDVEATESDGQITLMALFKEKVDAETAVARLASVDSETYWFLLGSAREIVDGPNVYRWVAQTTSSAQQVNPTGLTVERVYFTPSCLASGCWKVEVTFTVGLDNQNVLFIPKAVGSDILSYDFDYTVDDTVWGISPEDTFLPQNHPCTSADYDAGSTAGGGLPASITSCCLLEFLAMYRPVTSFPEALAAASGGALMQKLDAICGTGDRLRALNRTEVPILAQKDQVIDIAANVFPPPVPPQVSEVRTGVFVEGIFSGMNLSNVNYTGVVDAYVGIYTATLELDEVELRRMAAQLKGTVGVEHNLDTFVGLLELSFTGTVSVDPFATQTNLHLEKTNFFSVSTHGENRYTFLEYVNIRLVMIVDEDDADSSGDSEATNRPVRIDRAGNAAYCQVTFTMGSKYQPNLDSGGLVPLDSVRAGRGTFFNEEDNAGRLYHVCSTYDAANATLGDAIGLTGFTGRKDTYDTMLGQICGPQSSMCVSPPTVPDQFVSFNVPLGFGVFDGQASNDLSNSIFVSFAVNVDDTTATGIPNKGADPMQMKTMLTASIPIVAGGINIFCGSTAKSDLMDVANVDVVVGSAVNANELTRLQIMTDIASTALESVPSSEINTGSIESALMTLVIKGNESFFLTGASNTGDYTMELEDVISLHLMEDGEARVNVALGDGKEGKVMELLAAPGNDDSNGLDGDGYALNGAFQFTVDRVEGTAFLEPLDALLAQCPFNPPRPAAGSNPLESCILRRDVQLRGYPARTGSQSTAMEILAASRFTTGSTYPKDSTVERIAAAAAVLDKTSAESIFLSRILGASEYTTALAPDFARAINERYALNGRYRRAYWINPGYEWTPTQTAGKSIFSVSQKIYLFALISMDENWSRRRRRVLLQTTSGPASDPLAENDAGMNAASITFDVTPASMMAQALDVPEDRVALFALEMQLTQKEACMDPTTLQGSLRVGLKDMLSTTASSFLTVQVVKLSIDMGAEKCSSARRSIRKLLADFSTASATIQMLVVFDKGSASKFNMNEFAKLPGVNSVEPDARNSPKLEIVPVLDCAEEDCGEITPAASEDSSRSSSNAALIGGIAGGVGGALAIGAGVVLFMQSKRADDADAVAAIQTINVNDLKRQLADEV